MSALSNNSKHKNGFTLVEVIVVLVILAILAALLVPKLTGWIDQAKGKAAVGEGHLVLSAAQTVLTEKYANATEDDLVFSSSGTLKLYGKNSGGQNMDEKAFWRYAGDDINSDSGVFGNGIDYINWQVTSFVYTATNGTTIEYNYDSNNGTFTIVP